MKIKLSALVVLMSLTMVSGAFAVDEGQTKPRFNSADLNAPNSTADLIPYTAGSGNIKGIQCMWPSGADADAFLYVKFYVNGGAAQTFTFLSYGFSRDFEGDYYTGFIPMNVRFDTSIRVQLQRIGGDWLSTPCVVSWGLD